MPLSSYKAVQFAAAIYNPIQPIFKSVFRIGDWIVGYALDAENNPVFAIAGSERLQDFIADVEFLPTHAGQLGMVHGGFYKDAERVFTIIRPYITPKTSIIGHSLGGSRAAILAGICAINHLPIASLFMFEPAKPGYIELALQVHGFVPNIVATRNARDPVPDLPPSALLPYVHICKLIDLDNPANSIDPVDDHLMPAVTAGILKRWPE